MSVAHYENFPVASLLVPAKLRPAVIAIYRFARSADDLADEGDVTADRRLADLDAYQRTLDAIESGAMPSAPPFLELAHAVHMHHLPMQPFRDLISAFAQDVTTARYATYGALSDYCDRSANPIGRLLLHLYGAVTPINLICADAICTGLQLTNFWQDVAADWVRGRVYLPADDMARFEVSTHSIAEARADASWRALMRFETERTRTLLESGRPLVHALPWRLGLELSGVLAGGHWVLDAIDAIDGDVFQHRPYLRRIDWATVAWRAVVPKRYRLLPGGLPA